MPLHAVGLILTAEAALAQVDALEAPAHRLFQGAQSATIGGQALQPLDARASSGSGSTPVGVLAGREARAIEHETNAFRALRAGDPGAAATWFGRAVRAWNEQGLTVWQARAEGLRADALETTGRRAAARASRDRAAGILAAIESPGRQ